MRYWRDPDTGDVIKSNADAPADPGDVVVIPEADWQKLVASVRACGGRGAAPVDRIWEIIFRTEEANDA